MLILKGISWRAPSKMRNHQLKPRERSGTLSERKKSKEGKCQDRQKWYYEKGQKRAGFKYSLMRDRKIRVVAYIRLSEDETEDVTFKYSLLEEVRQRIKEKVNWEYMGAYIEEYEASEDDFLPARSELIEDGMAGYYDLVVTRSEYMFDVESSNFMLESIKLCDYFQPVIIYFWDLDLRYKIRFRHSFTSFMRLLRKLVNPMQEQENY